MSKSLIAWSISILLLAGITQAAVAATNSSSPDALLARAAAIVDLSQANAPGVMLLAKVHMQDGKQGTDGVYALVWTQDKHRGVFRFPGYEETDIIANNVIYRSRNTKGLPFLIYELARLVDFHSFLLPPTDKATILENRSGETCVGTHPGSSKQRICFDPSNGELRSVDAKVDTYDFIPFQEHFEFTDYQPFGHGFFPHKMTFKGWGSREVDVEVQKLFPVQTLPANEYTPPHNAERSGYCENPTVKGDLRPSPGASIPVGFGDTEVDMYFQVSSAGGVQYAQVVSSNNPLKSNEILNWFIGTHFPIYTCNGRPVGYETVVTLISGH